MKIIRASNLPDRTFFCADCGCEFEAKIGEYKITWEEPENMEQKTLEVRKFAVCNCPLCSMPVAIPLETKK